MNTLPNCPECQSEYTYEDGNLYVCPECGHEWTKESEAENTGEKKVYRDVNGNTLNDGDTVTVIKDLKVKGSSNALKMGTKIKNIRLVDGPDGHDLDCKVSGFGSIYVKSKFVKKI